ncbi:S41 family peptidase [uncultured Brevundimonas sp.]|uniref:S41 family peptidase n=1 Tax=uncultured Brevundimonas sp. TaxID=213418 RepID=UPI0025CE6017|nr:S41 family peptidase [uncultured Brevundimonas sp.]
MKAPVFIAALLLAASPALARQAETPAAPRVVVGQIAAAIRDAYFDPAKAETIAAALEAEAAQGRYDALTDPRDLETALTARLEPYDQHFSVGRPAPSTPAAATPATSSGLSPVPFPVVAARGGQGFRAVQILPGNVGLIDMRMFSHFEGGEDLARRQADAALQMVSGADAVIFDLRNNGGGSPAMVGYLVSAFVGPDADVYNRFHSRDGEASEAPAQPYAAPRVDVPVYVLISGRTGSAAEAFAYTLQAAKRAVVVGETSGGAANPGGPVFTPSGYRVFISTGSPTNPLTGANWEKVGVRPDVAVPAEDALETAWKAALAAQSNATPAAATEAAWVREALDAKPAAFDAAAYLGTYGGSVVQAGDDGLTWKNERRPAWRLRPLSPDLFFDADEPYRRIRFVRDEAGRVTALEVLDSQTGVSRLLRRSA